MCHKITRLYKIAKRKEEHFNLPIYRTIHFPFFTMLYIPVDFCAPWSILGDWGWSVFAECSLRNSECKRPWRLVPQNCLCFQLFYIKGHQANIPWHCWRKHRKINKLSKFESRDLSKICKVMTLQSHENFTRLGIKTWPLPPLPPAPYKRQCKLSRLRKLSHIFFISLHNILKLSN